MKKVLGSSKFERGFPGGLVVENPPTNAGHLGSIPGSGRAPGEGNDNPLQCSCLENPMDRRSLVGHSLWGYQELDMMEQLNKNNSKFERLSGSDP